MPGERNTDSSVELTDKETKMTTTTDVRAGGRRVPDKTV